MRDGRTMGRPGTASGRGEPKEMNWKVMGALAAVLVLALGALFVKRAVDAQRPQGTDVEQIQSVLLKGESAAERRDAAALGRLISDNYRDSLGMTETQIRYQIMDYLRNHSAIEVDLPVSSIETELAPDGRTARVRFRVRVMARGSSQESVTEVDMALTLAREPVRYFWVFPGEEWKITAAEGYGGLEGL